METFQLPWPKAENWRISHTRIEGEGMAVVMELMKGDESEENWSVKVSMTAYLSPSERPLTEVMEQVIQTTRNRYPQTHSRLLDQQTGSQPIWLLFLMENIQTEDITQSSISHLVKGNEGLYLNVALFPQAQLDEAIQQQWMTFFQSGQLVPQSLQETLKQSGLADFPKKQPSKPILDRPWRDLAHVQRHAHPAHPDDVHVWISNPAKSGKQRLSPVWTTIIALEGQLFWGKVLQEADFSGAPMVNDLVYFAYDPETDLLCSCNPLPPKIDPPAPEPDLPAKVPVRKRKWWQFWKRSAV